MKETISCIIPVYNNSETLAGEIKILASFKEIKEIIVIDDCSKDNSLEIMKSFSKPLASKVKILVNRRNLGKGGTVVKGLKLAKGETIFLCDADLSTLSKKYVKDLISAYRTGEFVMVIGNMFPREHLRSWQNIVSGQRILKRSLIEPYLKLIAKMGNGIEQITNFACRDGKIKIVYSKDPGHILKYQRGEGFRATTTAYTKEIWQLIRTELLLEKMRLKEIKRNGVWKIEL